MIDLESARKICERATKPDAKHSDINIMYAYAFNALPECLEEIESLRKMNARVNDKLSDALLTAAALRRENNELKANNIEGWKLLKEISILHKANFELRTENAELRAEVQALIYLAKVRCKQLELAEAVCEKANQFFDLKWGDARFSMEGSGIVVKALEAWRAAEGSK